MTCIVAFRHKDHFYMGADSIGANSYHEKHTRKDPKIFQREGFLIGFTSSFRMGQILMSSSFQPPKQRKGQTDFDYMISSFVDSVRDVFRESGFLTKDSDGEDQGGQFLICYKESVYKVHSNFQVAEHVDGFYAAGCGESFALASLYSTRDQGLKPKKRIRLALETASHFSCGVAPPYVIKKMRCG